MADTTLPKLVRLSPAFFAITLFLSATLVFSVQPMLGKMMLPHVGGSPAGWAVAMFFFQTCLLAGYGLSYLFSKLPPFLNIIAILLIFIPGALFLPITYYAGTYEAITPFTVFLQLTASAALPFLAISVLAPGLQRIFSFSDHPTAGDPYYLYAASNLGSFVGLLAYPLVLEPFIGTGAQSQFWTILYAVLFFAVMGCATSVLIFRRDLLSFSFKNTGRQPVKTDLVTHRDDKPITWPRRLRWLALAAIPSSLMIGVTTEITLDIASAPMIWVIPLSLYLVTNIVAFSKRKEIGTGTMAALHLLGVALVVIAEMQTTINPQLAKYAVILALIYLVIFINAAMLFHAMLANDRPRAQDLTEFYLFLALGGAIGGSFNAFIAPVIFNNIFEYQIILILSLMLVPGFFKKMPGSLSMLVFTLIAVGVVIFALLAFFELKSLYLLLAVVLFVSTLHPKPLFVLSLLTLIFTVSPLVQKSVIYQKRNFFGVLKVKESNLSGQPDKKIRVLSHGTTLHGYQPYEESARLKPQAYYGANGPVGDIMTMIKPADIAIIGLGVGQITCWNTPGRVFDIYEIDPDVVDVAREYFTQMEECGYRDIYIGDARLELEEVDAMYDFIAVDAFSSDSIPVHLMTSEAVDLYFDRTAEHGIVAFHISNRHLNLAAPLAAIAAEKNLHTLHKFYSNNDSNSYELSSHWLIMTENENFLPILREKGWQSIATDAKPWTDDYSNFLSTLRYMDYFKRREPQTENNE
jgi:spermidine synthase